MINNSSEQPKRQRFGVLGKSLAHTYSPRLHQIFDPSYSYEVIERDEEGVRSLFEKHTFDGFNVTIPYKKLAHSLCTTLSESAIKTGAVNTVVFRPDGEIFGDNTDVYGFLYLLSNAGIDVKGKSCLILGTGGASVAIKYALEISLAREILFCSRSGEINYGNVSEAAKDAQIIVNTTPVGMYPNVDEAPLDPSDFKNLEAVCDIVYNPGRTKLMQLAKSQGIKTAGGLTMLAAQALKASYVFTDKPFLDSNPEDADKISFAFHDLENSLRNIVLVGMPGCGKSTLSRALGAKLNREVIDLDVLFETTYKVTPAKIILEHGEDRFRTMETELAKTVLIGSGKIISCGGGIVTRHENDLYLRANSRVFYIERPLEALDIKGRPLSASQGTKRLFEQRHELYENVADQRIFVPRTASETEFVTLAIDKMEV